MMIWCVKIFLLPFNFLPFLFRLMKICPLVKVVGRENTCTTMLLLVKLVFSDGLIKARYASFFFSSYTVWRSSNLANLRVQTKWRLYFWFMYLLVCFSSGWLWGFLFFMFRFIVRIREYTHDASLFCLTLSLWKVAVEIPSRPRHQQNLEECFA